MSRDTSDENPKVNNFTQKKEEAKRKTTPTKHGKADKILGQGATKAAAVLGDADRAPTEKDLVGINAYRQDGKERLAEKNAPLAITIPAKAAKILGLDDKPKTQEELEERNIERKKEKDALRKKNDKIAGKKTKISLKDRAVKVGNVIRKKLLGAIDSPPNNNITSKEKMEERTNKKGHHK